MRERDDVERPIFSSLLFRERMEAVAGYVLGCVHFDLSHPILHVFKGGEASFFYTVLHISF